MYIVLPGMRLKDSNIACTFVTTGFPDNRSAFYKKCSDGPIQEIEDVDSENDEDEDENETSDNKKEVHVSLGLPIQIEGRTGMYTAATTVLERYVARPECLEQMCLAQFATSFTYQAKCPKTVDFDEDGCSKIKSNQQIFTSNHPLPRHIRLLDGLGLMRLRYYPAVLRFHTSKKKEGYEQYYSEMQLFTHWRNEEKEFHPENEVACLKMYDNRAEEILNNKKAIFPGEETIEMLESANWELMQPTHLIETLDPQGEQEGNDDMIEGIDDDPEFESFAYTGNLNLSYQENCSDAVRYKQIQVPNDLELNKMTQALVPEQMNVLRKVVSSCKDIVKARHNPLVKPKPVRLIVHGGAGVGKSKTIHSIARHAEKILRERGNNPLHPSVILCAFTAKAAKLIGGTTIHSAFGFKAGKEVTTLSDKRLVEMREHLAHLKLIVIDEISLVGADLLYRIHKRLTELFQTDVTVPFANVNMVLVGDLLQLPPVKETQVFKTPLGLDFAANKDSLNLWNSCEPMILKHNHRQGKEKEWANTLNRIRVGNVTEEDMRILKSRLTKDEMLQEYFMHLFFTNREVTEHNDKMLKKMLRKLYLIEAKQYLPGGRKSLVDPKKGTIAKTEFLEILKVKVGARVMLIINFDIMDELVNGSTGTVVGIETASDGQVQFIIVQFDDPSCGQRQRDKYPTLKDKYAKKNGTPIGKMDHEFFLSSRRGWSHSTKGKLQQFPLRLAYAQTAHKMQVCDCLLIIVINVEKSFK